MIPKILAKLINCYLLCLLKNHCWICFNVKYILVWKKKSFEIKKVWYSNIFSLAGIGMKIWDLNSVIGKLVELEQFEFEDSEIPEKTLCQVIPSIKFLMGIIGKRREQNWWKNPRPFPCPFPQCYRSNQLPTKKLQSLFSLFNPKIRHKYLNFVFFIIILFIVIPHGAVQDWDTHESTPLKPRGGNKPKFISPSDKHATRWPLFSSAWWWSTEMHKSMYL